MWYINHHDIQRSRRSLIPSQRLTLTTGLVLQAISDGFRYGFDIMEVSGLADGTVYPALRRLEAAGYLDSQWEDEEHATAEGRPRRRYYVLTPEGCTLHREARARFRGLRWATETDPNPA